MLSFLYLDRYPISEAGFEPALLLVARVMHDHVPNCLGDFRLSRDPPSDGSPDQCSGKNLLMQPIVDVLKILTLKHVEDIRPRQ